MSNVTPAEAKKSFYEELRALRDYLVSEYESVPETAEIVNSAYFHLCTWLDNSSTPDCPICLVTEDGQPITKGELHEEFFPAINNVEEDVDAVITEATANSNVLRAYVPTIVGLQRDECRRFQELNDKIAAAEKEEGDDLSPNEVLDEDEIDEYFYLSTQLDAEANYLTLYDVEEEAFDRVWYDRSSIGTKFEKPGTPEDIRAKALENQKRIEEEYDIDPEDCDDFYHGYWSGILATCRYIHGFTEDIDDLRYGDNGILDT